MNLIIDFVVSYSDLCKISQDLRWLATVLMGVTAQLLTLLKNILKMIFFSHYLL